jgi:hypothetical protein
VPKQSKIKQFVVENIDPNNFTRQNTKYTEIKTFLMQGRKCSGYCPQHPKLKNAAEDGTTTQTTTQEQNQQSRGNFLYLTKL